jgi:hypothetical protein
MSDEHHKAEWHMTEETVPERPYNGEWRPKVAARLVLLFVAVVILIPLFPLLVWASYYYRRQPPP